MGMISTEKYRQMMEDRPGQVGAKDPSTSRRSAQSHPRYGTQRWKVLRALERGPHTAHEIAEALGKSPNLIATRLGELREGGFVAYHRNEQGMRVERETTPGNTGLVQEITPLGRAVLLP